MLSAAITAGVAPLLFVQILYQRAFYTANLLLFHRWMAILPALLVGFYALYLLKNWPDRSRPRLRMATAGVTFACFAFVGWSWTENHLLSLQSQQVWVDQYVSQALRYRTSQLLPRLGIWFCGSFSILAIWLSWQLWWPLRPGAHKLIVGTRRTAAMAFGGLIAASGCALWYGSTLSVAQRGAVLGAGGPWLALAIIGVCVQLYLWWGQYRSAELCPRHLTALTIATVLTVIGVAVVREAIRLEAVDLAVLAEQHRQSTQVGGLATFALFLVLNTAVIVYCIRLVNHEAEE